MGVVVTLTVRPVEPQASTVATMGEPLPGSIGALGSQTIRVETIKVVKNALPIVRNSEGVGNGHRITSGTTITAGIHGNFSMRTIES